MFRATYRPSSGAPNCICNLWFIYPCGDRPLSRLDNGRSPHVYINQRLQIQFRAPDDERYAARNMLRLQFWNSKFYYKVASCWLFLLIHTATHGSINIKITDWCFGTTCRLHLQASSKPRSMQHNAGVRYIVNMIECNHPQEHNIKELIVNLKFANPCIITQFR